MLKYPEMKYLILIRYETILIAISALNYSIVYYNHMECFVKSECINIPYKNFLFEKPQNRFNNSSRIFTMAMVS